MNSGHKSITQNLLPANGNDQFSKLCQKQHKSSKQMKQYYQQHCSINCTNKAALQEIQDAINFLTIKPWRLQSKVICTSYGSRILKVAIDSIGDRFIAIGDTSSSSGYGSEYYYYEYHECNGDSATELHQIREEARGATARNESFHYSDSSTCLVNDISQYLDLYAYDSNTRTTTIDSTSSH